MRIAFFSPLPPAKSGIADYSAAVLEPLRRLAEVETFTGRPEHFDPTHFDACVYQIGNNPYHAAAYGIALEHPGIVVMHEANLHHLIADLTIKRNDWDAYLREVEFDGGPAALAHALAEVRTLKRGPDYEGVPMLRRLLGQSRGAIVHSDFVGDALRAAGFTGPIGRIWHGAWIVEPERMKWRQQLGLNESTPLIGIFGFLKPYKRIAESLRAFRRLLRVIPDAKMLLVGEPHPELGLASLIRTLGLEAHVRVIGFAPIDDFNGYLGACDIILNLRYPTVGESSGTLLRALGMGKAVVVSDVGSFREYPDTVCLKVPVDATEEDHIFEYLNLLVSRPSHAQALGRAAREWVTSECSWQAVARQYLAFCENPQSTPRASGASHRPPEPVQANAAIAVEVPAEERTPYASEILSWTEPGAKKYVESHLTRLDKTLQVTPLGGPEERILEMGAYLQITPALKTKLGYGEVRGCYFGKAGNRDLRKVTAESGQDFECEMDLFNAEKDPFPYEDGYFSTVLCCELIEHLFEDPMHMMCEINRVLKLGGHLVLSTPNIVSLRAIAGLLQGYQPGLFPSYIKPRPDGHVDARHNREYTPREISDLLADSGFEVTLLETGPFLDAPRPDLRWVEQLLRHYMLTEEHRGEGIYVVGRKTGAVRARYPEWLYS